MGHRTGLVHKENDHGSETTNEEARDPQGRQAEDEPPQVHQAHQWIGPREGLHPPEAQAVSRRRLPTRGGRAEYAMDELRFPELLLGPGQELATFVITDRSLRLDSWNMRIDNDVDRDLIISDFAVDGHSRMGVQPPDGMPLHTEVLHKDCLGGGMSFGRIEAGSSILLRIKNPTSEQKTFRCRINLRRAGLRA